MPSDVSKFEVPRNNIACNLNYIALSNPTFLNENVAKTISSFSTATRFSLRISALIFELILETSKYSTVTSMSLSRRALISAIRNANQIRRTDSKSQCVIYNTDRQCKTVLDKYTDLGIYFVHQTFTLAELFALSGFHFFSSTIKSGIWAAEESVRILDGLFGSTETSRALAKFVMIVQSEFFQDEEFALGLSKDKYKFMSIIAQSLTSLACLQAVTFHRRTKEIKATLLYEGHVPLQEIIKYSNENTKSLITRSRSDPGVSHGSLKHPLESFKDISSKTNFFKKSNNLTQMRRSKSFSHLPTRKDAFFPGGLIELIDQSEDLGENNHSFIGDQVVLENDWVPNVSLRNYSSEPEKITQAKSQEASPPISPVPASTVNSENNESPGKKFTDFVPQEDTIIPLIYRFMRYSSAAYGSHFLKIFGPGTWEEGDPGLVHHPNHYAFSQHTATPLESIIFSSFSSVSSTFSSGVAGFLQPATLHPLVHYVAVDHGMHAIVLTCRGTLGISDLLTDGLCDYEPLPLEGLTTKTHSGMLLHAQKMADPTSEVHGVISQALDKYPGYGLVLCGHSLGAGVVSLLSLLWSERSSHKTSFGSPLFMTSKLSELPPGRFIHCYSYGCPALLSKEGSLFAKGLITSLINRDDIVPYLSLGSVVDLKSVATTLNEENNLTQLIITRALGINDRLVMSGSNTNFSSSPQLTSPHQSAVAQAVSVSKYDDWFWSVIKTLRAGMQSEKLVPPGQVYLIDTHTTVKHNDSSTCDFSPGSQKCLQVVLRRCEDVAERFKELTFSRTMMSDHAPIAYEDSLKALAASLAYRKS